MNNRKRSLSIPNNMSLGRIQSMPESTSAFVRAGQVIGSPFRAIEEIMRNSILHGLCSNVAVTMKKTNTDQLVLEITDDGLGLEEIAMRDLIGTRYCSSTGSLSGRSIASRGESLKAIADLCIEFRITSTHGILKTDRSSDRSQASSGSLLTAPSKKKRRDYRLEHDTSPLEFPRKYSHLVTCEKIIQNGTVVSFKSSTHQALEIEGQGTGTIIQLIGLFHRHHVRQKHYLRNSTESSATRNDDGFSCSKIKHCIQMLAMAFPFVNFRFYPPTREHYEWLTPRTVTQSFDNENWQHQDWWSFIRFRFRQMIGDKFNNDSTIVKIDLNEDINIDGTNKNYGGHCIPINDEGTQWKVQGILYINPIFLESETCARSRQHELIFINHRLSRNSTSIADIVQRVCSQLYGIQTSNGWLFAMYITCPYKDVDLIVDDTKSYSFVRQIDRLLKLITHALTKALENFPETLSATKMSSIISDVNTLAPRDANQDEILKEPFNCLSKRIITGKTSKRTQSTPEEITQISLKPNQEPSSPFSDAFLESMLRSTCLPKQQLGNKLNSFDSIQNGKLSISSMQWTRSRLRALNAEIKNVSETQDSSYYGLKITKTMLSNSQIIGQVDSKYILVLMDGILCAIDQHAADERIGLERLERLLESIIEGNDASSIRLSKMEGLLNPCDLLKSTVLEERQEIYLSSSQIPTVLQNKNLLKKWYFDFDLNDRTQTLILKSVPVIYDKVSTPKDFIHFIQVLSNRTSDASCCKPAFFTRALASLACRYAIMFGDNLNNAQCKEIVLSLEKCDLSFICAHGRPSIVPLFDMSQLDKSKVCSKVDRNLLPLRLRNPPKDPYLI